MGEEGRGGNARTTGKTEEGRGVKKDGDGGMEQKRREHKQDDNVSPESAVPLPLPLSTHIYISICLFSFLTPPFSPEIFPLSA